MDQGAADVPVAADDGIDGFELRARHGRLDDRRETSGVAERAEIFGGVSAAADDPAASSKLTRERSWGA
jgi:hypothetical protein